MYLQKRIAQISLSISILFIIPFTFFSFNTLCLGIKLETWISQLSLSISASSIIVCITAYSSYRIERYKLLIKIIQDLRSMFDVIDDYYQVIKIKKSLYINEYYDFRNQIRNFFNELNLEPLCFNKGDLKVLEDVVQAYTKLSNLAYYSYIEVKKYENGKSVNKQGLNDILQELNDYIINLVESNWCNNKAALLMKKYKFQYSYSIDDYESKYKNKYYKKNSKGAIK